MMIFFMKGLGRFSELIFGNRTDRQGDRWVGYREQKQLEQEIKELQEKAFFREPF